MRRRNATELKESAGQVGAEVTDTHFCRVLVAMTLTCGGTTSTAGSKQPGKYVFETIETEFQFAAEPRGMRSSLQCKVGRRIGCTSNGQARQLT